MNRIIGLLKNLYLGALDLVVKHILHYLMSIPVRLSKAFLISCFVQEMVTWRRKDGILSIILLNELVFEQESINLVGTRVRM